MDDMYLPPPHQRFLADLLAEAARRRLGVYDGGRFTPRRGREQQAAEFLTASAAYLPDVLAEHLDALRSTA